MLRLKPTYWNNIYNLEKIITLSYPPAKTMTPQEIKSHLSLAMSKSEEAVGIGNVYGSEVTALARHLKGTQNQQVLEAAARDMAAELFPRLKRAGQTFDSDPTSKIKHLTTGLVLARYSLAPIVTPDMAWRMSEGYGVSFLVKAFCTSQEHMKKAVRPDKLREWASATMEYEADFARRCAANKRVSDIMRAPLSLPPMELVEIHGLLNAHLADKMLEGVRAGAYAHMDTFSKIGGADDLDALKRSALEARSFAIADTLSKVIDSYRHAEPASALEAYTP